VVRRVRAWRLPAHGHTPPPAPNELRRHRLQRPCGRSLAASATPPLHMRHCTTPTTTHYAHQPQSPVTLQWSGAARSGSGGAPYDFLLGGLDAQFCELLHVHSTALGRVVRDEEQLLASSPARAALLTREGDAHRELPPLWPSHHAPGVPVILQGGEQPPTLSARRSLAPLSFDGAPTRRWSARVSRIGEDHALLSGGCAFHTYSHHPD
jgi:hypothetical protein